MQEIAMGRIRRLIGNPVFQYKMALNVEDNIFCIFCGGDKHGASVDRTLPFYGRRTD